MSNKTYLTSYMETDGQIQSILDIKNLRSILLCTGNCQANKDTITQHLLINCLPNPVCSIRQTHNI